MQYWAVGAHHGEDVSNHFIENGIWYDGHAENGDNQNEKKFKKVTPGDILLMKSVSTKGPEKRTSFTRVKAIGEVIDKIKNHYFKVKWFNIEGLPKDFDNITYWTTIEEMREDKMLEFARNIIEKEKRKNMIELLKHKKQLILQGPPGTGKTYKAKELAKQMTGSFKDLKPLEYFESFIKNYKRSEENRKKISQLKVELQSFREAFPPEELKKLTLDRYCIGRGDHHNFCYWLERKLEKQGKFLPGGHGAITYGVYYSKADGSYIVNENYESSEDAISEIAKAIHGLVNNHEIEQAQNHFRNGLVMKILNSYVDDEKFFPVYSHGHIKKIANMLNITTGGKNEIQINDKINKTFKLLRQKHNKTAEDISIYEIMWHLYDNFDIKRGIAEVTEEIKAENLKYENYELVQFHPAYTYEDFVRGIKAETSDNGDIKYEVKDQIFVNMCKRASNDPTSNYVLIIDEINRANLPAVLGELIYGLEKDKRGTSFQAMYANNDNTEEEDQSLTIPENLYIIGTMNTADRSIGHIDYAIRRRFAFKDMQPQSSVIDTDEGINWFDKVQEVFDNHTAGDFNNNHVRIGHSYFMVNKKKDSQEEELAPLIQLRLQMEFEVLPILHEYLNDGVLDEAARSEIEKLEKEIPNING